MRLRLQPKTGVDTVQVALDVELQQISGIVAWTALVGRLNPLGSSRLEVEAAAECINQTHRVVRPHVVVHSIRQKQKLGPVFTSYVIAVGIAIAGNPPHRSPQAR